MGKPFILLIDVKDFFPGTWDRMTPKEQESWRRKFAIYREREIRRIERWTGKRIRHRSK